MSETGPEHPFAHVKYAKGEEEIKQVALKIGYPLSLRRPGEPLISTSSRTIFNSEGELLEHIRDLENQEDIKDGVLLESESRK